MKFRGTPTIEVRALVFITASALTLTSCSVMSPSSQIEEPKVSQVQINKALKRVEAGQDEYTGRVELTGKGKWHVDTGGYGFIGAGVTLAKEEEVEDWSFLVASSFYDSDWLFHDSVDFKSSKAAMAVDVGSPQTEVHDSGFVSEFGSVRLTESQITEFCTVMSGTSVKFRLSGRKGGISRPMTKTMVYDNIALCNLFTAFRQGSEISFN
jgi:cold shock CspA family protein